MYDHLCASHGCDELECVPVVKTPSNSVVFIPLAQKGYKLFSFELQTKKYRISVQATKQISIVMFINGAKIYQSVRRNF